MTINKPKITKTIRALLEADFIAFFANYKATLIVFVIPIILLFGYQKVAKVYGASFLISIAITVTLLAIGLTTYPISIAKDRDLGIFQRLRITPTPSWAIMGSKIIVQICSALTSTIVSLIAGIIIYSLSLSFLSCILLFFTVLIASALYLSIGQAMVGLIKSADTINAVSRFVYIPTLLLGMLGELGILGTDIQNIAKWSPFGTVQNMLVSSLIPSTWNNTTWLALLVTLGYTLFFAFIGIRLFQWDSK